MNAGIEALAYESEVLDPQVHGRLVQEIESVARRAGIPVQMVWTSMKDYCSEEEIAYVRDLRSKSPSGIYGLYYVGVEHGADVTEDKKVVTIPDRMQAIAAACVRNYINAQVMQVNDVIRHVQAGSMPEPTVLLIPNFYIGNEAGIPQWRSGALLDLLYSRQAAGLQTFVYVKDKEGLKDNYGAAFVLHLSKFQSIEL